MTFRDIWQSFCENIFLICERKPSYNLPREASIPLIREVLERLTSPEALGAIDQAAQEMETVAMRILVQREMELFNAALKEDLSRSADSFREVGY